MKQVKSKITGNIGDLDFDSKTGMFTVVDYDSYTKVMNTTHYISLEDLCEEWEDYEEPKEYWYIDYDGGILCGEHDNSSAEKMMINMGNCFESLEEAEKAVEKLKAWKRLKDKGFKLDAVVDSFFCLDIYMKGGAYEEIKEDLNIVFGGEE